jgi:hypothetical protein
MKERYNGHCKLHCLLAFCFTNSSVLALIRFLVVLALIRFLVVLQGGLIAKMLLLYVEDTAKGLVSYSSFFYYRFSSLVKKSRNQSILLIKFILHFQRLHFYDPMRKWMDNCYRGVPLGGLGSVL